MKRILKNKRGVAMESAVFFMLVMFMFGFLLTAVAMTAHLRVKVNNNIITREMEIEQIGENFVHDLAEFVAPQTNEIAIKNYTATIGEHNGNKTLTLKRRETVVLYVEAENTTIKVWKYTD